LDEIKVGRFRWIAVAQIDHPQTAGRIVGQGSRTAAKFVDIAEHIIDALFLVRSERAVDTGQVQARGVHRAFIGGVAELVQDVAGLRIDKQGVPIAQVGIKIHLPDQMALTLSIQIDRLFCTGIRQVHGFAQTGINGFKNIFLF